MFTKLILALSILSSHAFANINILSPFCRIGLESTTDQNGLFTNNNIKNILQNQGYELAIVSNRNLGTRAQPQRRTRSPINDFIIESSKELCITGRRSDGTKCYKLGFYQKLPNTRDEGVAKHYLAHEKTLGRPTSEEITDFVKSFPSCQKSGYHTRSKMFFDCRNFGRHRVHTAPVGAVCVTRAGAQVKLIEKNGQKQIWQDLATEKLYSYGFDFINIRDIADVMTACSRLGEGLTSQIAKSKKWQLTSNDDILEINEKNIFEVLTEDRHHYTRVSLSPNNEVSDYYFGPQGLEHGPTVRVGGHLHSHNSICIGK